MTYPTTLDTTADFPQTITDDTDATSGTPLPGTGVGFLATLLRKAGQAIVAVETELGVLPKGSFTDVATRLAARGTCRKTADQTISSTVALTNLTDLVLPIATTGLDYYFKFIAICTSSAGATNGIRIGLTCPALTGYVAAKVIIPRTLDTTQTAGTAQVAPTIANQPWEGYITASADSVVADIVPVGVNFPVIVEGILSNPSATGSIQLQAANEVTTASGNVIKKGSYGEIYIN